MEKMFYDFIDTMQKLLIYSRICEYVHRFQI